MTSPPLPPTRSYPHKDDECHFLQLPAEIIVHIISYLPLSTHLILRTQVCRTLRTRDGGVGLGPLRFQPPHRFVFSEWQKAAEEFQGLGLALRDDDGDDERGDDESVDTKSSAVVLNQPSSGEATMGWNGAASLAPRADRLNTALSVILSTGPALEARLFRRVLAYLGMIQPEKAVPPRGAARPGRRRPPKIPTVLDKALLPWQIDTSAPEHEGTHSRSRLRVMSLISWNGLSGEALVHFLRTEPAFRSIELIVKTDRFDTEAWENVLRRDCATTVDKGQTSQTYRDQNFSSSLDCGLGLDLEVALDSHCGHSRSIREMPRLPGSSDLDPTQEEEDAPKPPKAYTETQVIANVGCKAPPSIKIKGRGLSAGYRAFCYAARSGFPSAESSSEEQCLDRTQSRRLHVIFVGRSQVGEAMEMEEMLAYSRLRCNACKEEVPF